MKFKVNPEIITDTPGYYISVRIETYYTDEAMLYHYGPLSEEVAGLMCRFMERYRLAKSTKGVTFNNIESEIWCRYTEVNDSVLNSLVGYIPNSDIELYKNDEIIKEISDCEFELIDDMESDEFNITGYEVTVVKSDGKHSVKVEFDESDLLP